MRILFLCHRFPYPPQRGGKIRPFNMIRHLSQRHAVTVMSLARSAREAEAGRGIEQLGVRYRAVKVWNPWQGLRMVARIPTRCPSSFGYFYARGLARAVDRFVSEERPDLIIVHCSSVASYVANVRDVPKLLDFGDMDSQKWAEYGHHKPFPISLGYRLEALKLEAEEARLAQAFDYCTATTAGEWETLRRIAPARPSDWFPNGVDSEYFSPSSDPYDPDTICFVGRMDYYPNQACMFDFCERVWPLLRVRRHHLRLQIVGADPPKRIRSLARIPGVEVTGSVPDVRPYVRRSALMVAPLSIARGTQNKILEAMAMGVPVVTTPLAARGVDAIPGEDLVVAQSPQEVCGAILCLLERREERNRIAHAARERVLTHHAWSTSMARLDEIIDRCVGSFRAGTSVNGLLS